MSIQCECGHKHGTGRIQKHSDEEIQQYLVPVEYRKPASWFRWPLYYLRCRNAPMIAPCMIDIGDIEWKEDRSGWNIKMRSMSVSGVDSIENFETLKRLYLEDRANLPEEKITSYFETPYLHEIIDPYAKRIGFLASLAFLLCFFLGFIGAAYYIGLWSLLVGGVYIFFLAVAKPNFLYAPLSMLFFYAAKNLSIALF